MGYEGATWALGHFGPLDQLLFRSGVSLGSLGREPYQVTSPGATGLERHMGLRYPITEYPAQAPVFKDAG